MHARRFWQSMLSVTAATILIGQQILAKAVVAQAQDNLNGIPILQPPYPPVTAATWEGYTNTNFESVFPDGVTACESFKTLLTSPLTSPTLEGIKLEYFTEGGKEGEVYQNLCYLKALNINDGQYYYYDYTSRVSCPIIALPNRYIYIGGTHGVCVLPYMLEGMGAVEGAVGIWESAQSDNIYQMVVLWNPQTNRYEGYLIEQGTASETVGFKIGELVWTGTPTGAGTLNESQKWRWMQGGISYEEWRNGSASISQDQKTLVSSAAETNFERRKFINVTDTISGGSGDDVLLGGRGKDVLSILRGSKKLSTNSTATRPVKKTKSGQSGKEAARDVPSWAKGERPYRGESGDQFATRLLDNKYGKDNYKKNAPDTEYSKIKKWGERAFED